MIELAATAATAAWPESRRYARLRAALSRLMLRVQRAQRLRATTRALQGLSDRTLKDIGIDRSEIPSFVATLGRDRRPPRLGGENRTP